MNVNRIPNQVWYNLVIKMPSTLIHSQLLDIVSCDVSQVEILDLSGKDLGDVEDLSCCRSLKRIELRNNKLSSLKFLQLNADLRWIDAQKNMLSGCLRNIMFGNLKELTVLNLSNNQLTNVNNSFSSFINLKTLVLSENQLTSFGGIEDLQSLEALILSNNRIVSFTMPNRRMPNLKKLSLGNNLLEVIEMNDNVFNLRELRLNKNKLSGIPKCLNKCVRLEIVDLGKNDIHTSISQCNAQFSKCKALKSLNLAGNMKLAGTPMEWDTISLRFQKEIPTLQIFNSKNFSSKTRHTENQERVTEVSNSLPDVKENKTLDSNNKHIKTKLNNSQEKRKLRKPESEIVVESISNPQESKKVKHIKTPEKSILQKEYKPSKKLKLDTSSEAFIHHISNKLASTNNNALWD